MSPLHVGDAPARPVAQQVALLAAALLASGQRLATAESCTGGLIAACCTDLAGSSNWFERGFVTYSNEAKTELLGVDADLIATHGAVSEPVARAMVTGALRHSRADWAVAVTGIAGPTGGSPDKPVGTVWLAWCGPDGAAHAERHVFSGNRASVREQTVACAVSGLIQRINDASADSTASV